MGFTIYPALDIRGGKCVRLIQGNYDLESTYYQDPLEPALQWSQAGAEWLHIIDLDGARTGQPVNLPLIQEIIAKLDLKIQIGGGIRSLNTAKAYLEGGASRVILGTVALNNFQLVREMLTEFGKEKVIVSIDGRDNRALKEGWLEKSENSLLEAILKLSDLGIKTFIYTDVERDGTLRGPNIAQALELARQSGKEIIIAGGISQNQDVLDLLPLYSQGITGAVIGRALYTGDVKLPRLLEQIRGGN
ncbi:MAG: 1-(5-phosphoribosyl)-5-[(5-phosphoribosylamino)methylideneamino]imidazole-4-carboxamide isomerase [Clostridia bacterium]|mgnify:CR=1 FL=1|jgi:phosphoribosylformimino-5-aminoimidazole carboxamide ribotide isomerase|nr:1-(5-phosphoribosyl)-5-[(5-phosphoribosylamino)methylideneamino]imidazole-4-carboxamide isomerase [Clostridia bacterium]